MFKKLLSFLVLLFSVCSSTWASKTVNGNTTTWDFTVWNSGSPQGDFPNITQYGYIAELDGLTLNPDVAVCRVKTDGTGYINLNGGAIIHVPVTQGAKVKFWFKSLETNNSGGYAIYQGDTQLAYEWYGSTNVGSKEVTAPGNGEITFTSNNQFAVTKIVLVTPQVITDPNVASFSENAITAKLISLNVIEPQLTCPNGASVTYSSSNTKVAQVNASSGDVMMTNTGITTITATVGYNGQTYTASYTLTVESGAATYVIDGDEFRFEYVYADGDDNIEPHPDGSGKLLDRVVTGIEHITMEFGNVNETNAYSRNQTIVRNETGKGLVATTLDANGWRNLWWHTDNGHTVPYQGTFYTFRPTANGTLKVRGYLTSTTQSASLVDATNGYQRVAEITTSSTTQLIETTVQLTAGHTYYLYGDICNDNGDYTEHANNKTRGSWSMYELQSFVFSSGFKYAKKSVILPEGHTSYLQSLAASGVTYTYNCLGDVAADFDTSNGAISNIRKKDGSEVLGGAIVVTASHGSISTYYVLTIPYDVVNTNKSFTWRFDGVDLGIANSDALSMYYKVRRYDDVTYAMTQCTKPVISNDLSLEGDNAYYFGATAGLIVEAYSQSFGANATVVDLLADATSDQLTDATWVDQQLKTMLNYEYPSANVSNPRQITMNKNVTLKIPGLKAGQHVQIKWDHHLNGKLGDSFTVTNAKDLDGTVIPSDAQLKVGVTHALNSANEMKIYGSEEFIVAESNKDFEFHITDEGWVNIYEITISDVNEDIPSDIILFSAALSHHLDGKTRTISHSGSGTTYYFTGTTHHGGSRCTYGLGMNYEIAQTVGTVNSSIDPNNGTLSISSGRGILKIVTRAKTNGYTLDKREDWIPITIEGKTPHTYPYTWDFQNMYSYIDNQMSACAGENVFWKKVGDAYTYQTRAIEYGDVLLATPEATDGSSYSQLYAHDNVIPDIEGLYFQTNNKDRNGRFIEINKNGLKVCSARNHKVVVPNVGTDQYVYIRVAGTDGAITNGINGTSYDPYKTVGTDRVYRFQGTGGDLTVWMGGVTIKQIGVTGITKTLYDGYATESRDVAIDHSLTNVFTGDGVVAQYVKNASYDRNSASVTLSDFPTTTNENNDKAIHQVVPANTGVVLKCTDKVGESSYPGVPFFVPAMRTTSSTVSDNMLAASVTATTLSETMNVNGRNYTPFIFTKKYHTYTVTDGVGAWGSEQTADEYGYYRLAAEYGSTISANKSYLLVPGLDAALWAQSGSVKGITILNLDDSALGIGSVASPMEQGVFYNLSGSKVTTPTQPGVYIYNGKKIMVK